MKTETLFLIVILLVALASGLIAIFFWETFNLFKYPNPTVTLVSTNEWKELRIAASDITIKDPNMIAHTKHEPIVTKTNGEWDIRFKP